jgi:hypothetical protein
VFSLEARPPAFEGVEGVVPPQGLVADLRGGPGERGGRGVGEAVDADWSAD